MEGLERRREVSVLLTPCRADLEKQLGPREGRSSPVKIVPSNRQIRRLVLYVHGVLLSAVW